MFEVITSLQLSLSVLSCNKSKNTEKKDEENHATFQSSAFYALKPYNVKFKIQNTKTAFKDHFFFGLQTHPFP